MALAPNYPNPFNAQTAIPYTLPEESAVEIQIYNPAGQQVRTLAKEGQPAGAHLAWWDGMDQRGQPVASGIYLYTLKAGAFVAARKMILLR